MSPGSMTNFLSSAISGAGAENPVRPPTESASMNYPSRAGEVRMDKLIGVFAARRRVISPGYSVWRTVFFLLAACFAINSIADDINIMFDGGNKGGTGASSWWDVKAPTGSTMTVVVTAEVYAQAKTVNITYTYNAKAEGDPYDNYVPVWSQAVPGPSSLTLSAGGVASAPLEFSDATKTQYQARACVTWKPSYTPAGVPVTSCHTANLDLVDPFKQSANKYIQIISPPPKDPNQLLAWTDIDPASSKLTVRAHKDILKKSKNGTVMLRWKPEGAQWSVDSPKPGQLQLKIGTNLWATASAPLVFTSAISKPGMRWLVRACFEDIEFSGEVCSDDYGYRMVPVFDASAMIKNLPPSSPQGGGGGGGGTDKQDKFLSGDLPGGAGTASAKDSQAAIAKAGPAPAPVFKVTDEYPSFNPQVILPANGAVYPKEEDLPVRLTMSKSGFASWGGEQSLSKWKLWINKAGTPASISPSQKFVVTEEGDKVNLESTVPYGEFGTKPAGSWKFQVHYLGEGGKMWETPWVQFAYDSPSVPQNIAGPKFGSKVPQIAKGTGPAFSGGVPATQFPPNPCIGPGCLGSSQTGTGDGTSSGAGTFSEPAPATPRGFGSRMPPPPVGGGGIASRSAGPMPTDAAPGMMVPGPATTATARTADLVADLEVVSLSLDGNCNVWATLKNGGSAAIRDTVKESVALDGRNVLTSSVALNLAPGQSQRRQVASYGRINFAEASVRYDVDFTDANAGNNSLEQALTCPRASSETPTRTAPAPGIAPAPSGRTLPGR